MAKVASQTINGKAFEYALLKEFLERLKAVTTVSIVGNDPYKTALKCFLSFNEKDRSHYSLVAFENIKPKTKVPKPKLPSRLIEVVYQENSKTTLLVTLNEGWQISFRIHNASSRIEPSLKFDINLVSAPHSLFTNQLFIG